MTSLVGELLQYNLSANRKTQMHKQVIYACLNLSLLFHLPQLDHHAQGAGEDEGDGGVVFGEGAGILGDEPQVRDQAHPAGHLDGEADATAAFQRPAVNAQAAQGNVGDQGRADAEEEVGVQISERLGAKVRKCAGDVKSVVAGPYTYVAMEPVTCRNIEVEARAEVGIPAALVVGTRQAGVEADAATDEGTRFPVLGKSRGRHHQCRQGQKEFSFHILRKLETILDAENNRSPQIQREAGIALEVLFVLLRGFQAVVIVREGLGGDFHEGAQPAGEVVLADGTQAEAESRIAVLDLLPGVSGIGEGEGLGKAAAGQQLEAEGVVRMPVAQDIQEDIGKEVHMLEVIRVKTAAGGLQHVAGGDVLAVTGLQAYADDAVEVVAEVKRRLIGERRLLVVQDTEEILIQVEHWAGPGRDGPGVVIAGILCLQLHAPGQQGQYND